MRTRPTWAITMHEMFTLLKEEWKGIPVAVYQNVVESLSQRAMVIIAVKGDMTLQWRETPTVAVHTLLAACCIAKLSSESQRLAHQRKVQSEINADLWKFSNCIGLDKPLASYMYVTCFTLHRYS